MRLKPQAKMALAIILIAGTTVGIKSGIEHGLIPTPGIVKAVTNPHADGTVTWTPNDIAVQRDGDWNIAQGYSNGDDALIGKYRQPDDTTGYPALDNALRYVWNNAGMLIFLFGLLAAISIVAGRSEGETHNEQMRREAEELEQPGLSEDIHEPFDAPEGMQPASQYVSVRTRQ